MNEHRFEMRLSCRYQPPENTVSDLSVEQLSNAEWQPLQLDTGTPGFLIFVYSIFTCQHLYLRSNCAERGLSLASSEGSIRLATDEDWKIDTLRVDFLCRLEGGRVGSEDIDYIVGRMRQCPVSNNLAEITDSRTRLRFE